MIVKLLNNPLALYQKCADEWSVPEPTILGSVDSGELIVLRQEGREIIINPESVPELCKMLRTLKGALNG